MSDCANQSGYDVLRLQADFEGQENPWMYPLALNGRKLVDFSVNGVRYVPERTCHSDNEPIRLYNDKYHVFRCSECHHRVNLCYCDKPMFCPSCGAKVVDE